MHRASSVVATTVIALVMATAAASAGGRSSEASELADSFSSGGDWPAVGRVTTSVDAADNPIKQIDAAGATAASISRLTNPPRMSRREVGHTVLAIMANEARQLGRSLAKPRIISITFVKAGETYPVPVGGRHSFRWWSVRAQGTLMSCGGTTCGIASRGTIAIADATGCDAGGSLSGHITIIPVDQVKPSTTTAPAVIPFRRRRTHKLRRAEAGAGGGIFSADLV